MMELAATTIDGMIVVEGPPGQALLATGEDSIHVVAACISHGAEAALLYAENLPAAFFDLSSGQAGAVLQKLRNYRLRLAVVCPEGSVQLSPWFQALLAEERQGRDFGVFETREAAQGWLRQDEAGAG